MDFETFVESLFDFVKNSGNLYFLLYALLTCLFTQLVKKLFVNKVKVDVEHKFDFAVVLPFVFGTLFAAADIFFVRHCAFEFPSSLVRVFVDGTTIGALSSVIFKFVSSLSGKSVKSLMKDDVFGVFYTQLLYFGEVRQRLTSGQLTYAEFLEQVRVVAANAVGIYMQDVDDQTKREKLAQLLGGLVDDKDINLCVNVINRALIALTKKDDDQPTDNTDK